METPGWFKLFNVPVLLGVSAPSPPPGMVSCRHAPCLGLPSALCSPRCPSLRVPGMAGILGDGEDPSFWSIYITGLFETSAWSPGAIVCLCLALPTEGCGPGGTIRSKGVCVVVMGSAATRRAERSSRFPLPQGWPRRVKCVSGNQSESPSKTRGQQSRPGPGKEGGSGFAVGVGKPFPLEGQQTRRGRWTHCRGDVNGETE